jgi:hypothetical protein
MISRFVLIILTLPALIGCDTQRELSHAADPAQMRAKVDAQAAIVFAAGALYKPNPVPVETLGSKLAPLIIQQLDAARPGVERDQFGSVEAARVDPDHPAVYTADGDVTVHGQTHAQVSFVWCYPRKRGQPDSACIQGLRITLNSAGAPVVWEPLFQKENRCRVFVAESLEAATAAEFGRPLPGRRYSIEPGLEQSPGLAVVRVIDDGPLPMGPIIYLQARTRDISTVLCRCMAAQVGRVSISHWYDLLPLEELVAQSAAPSRQGGALLDALAQSQQAATRLRLPREW